MTFLEDRCRRAAALITIVVPASAAAFDSSTTAPPVAPVRPVTDTYFGTPVVDPYRYLENLKDPEVEKWMKAQAAYTKGILAGLPGRNALLERIHALAQADTRRGGFVRRGQRYFYQVIEPGSEQPKLMYRDGLSGAEHLLIDPSTLGKGTSTHYAIDYYTPSWDGRYIAYGLSAGGSEASTLKVMDVSTGKDLPERIARAHNSVITWRPDNRSFFYFKFNQTMPETPASETEYNARTYLHTLGRGPDGESDPVVFGRGVRTGADGLDVPEGQATYGLGSPQSPWVVAVANHNLDDNPSPSMSRRWHRCPAPRHRGRRSRTSMMASARSRCAVTRCTSSRARTHRTFASSRRRCRVRTCAIRASSCRRAEASSPGSISRRTGSTTASATGRSRD